MQKILKTLRKADAQYGLIQDGDHIIVGVSGGKDSMLLAKTLHQYQKFDHVQFKLSAVHMQMGFPNESSKTIKQYMEALQITYYEEEVPIYPILTHYLKEDQSIDCSRCSSLKRGAIVSIAKKLNANKIAFAHHSDDAIETFFMNAIYAGKNESFKPKIIYVDNDVTFIRPFILTSERDIIQSIKKQDIPIVKSSCPKDKLSKREDIKQLVQGIYKQFPSARKNLLNTIKSENPRTWKDNKKNT